MTSIAQPQPAPNFARLQQQGQARPPRPPMATAGQGTPQQGFQMDPATRAKYEQNPKPLPDGIGYRITGITPEQARAAAEAQGPYDPSKPMYASGGNRPGMPAVPPNVRLPGSVQDVHFDPRWYRDPQQGDMPPSHPLPGGSPYHPQGQQPGTPGGGAPVGGGGSPYPQTPNPTPGGGVPIGPGGSPWVIGGQGNPGGTYGSGPRPPTPQAPQSPAPRPQGPGGYQGGVPPATPQPGQQGAPAPYPTQPGYPGAPPDLENMWKNLAGGGGANYHPGGYQGPGTLNAQHDSRYALPQVQDRGNFTAPQNGQQVDARTQQAIMQALGNPSRYGAPEVGAAFDVLNHRLTQQGNADKQMIDEDMASRGIHASTTAGGRLGDLATNLNQQRADYATNLATDQAKTFQGDRSMAIADAMGFGGQQFGQGLQGFEANQNAGQQRFNQEMGAGDFGLRQNEQNYTQRADQYGRNQQEGLNRFNSGMDQADFGLRQNGQNFNQRFIGTRGLQDFGQQSFDNQMSTARFNSDQDYRNNDMILRSLGML